MKVFKNIGEYSNSLSLDNYYNQIKNLLFLKAGEINNKNKFKELKSKFILEVNSNRRMNSIQDIESLIEVLQKRNEIHVLKTELLEQMYDFYNIDKTLIHEHNQFLSSLEINSPGTIKKLNYVDELKLQNNIPLGTELYKSCYVTPPRITNQSFPPTNCHNYDSKRQERRNTQSRDCEPLDQELETVLPEPSCSKVYNDNEDKYMLPERVIEIVCTIGRKWYELARHLSFRGGRIDEIEHKHPHSFENRIRMVLEEYQQNCKKDLKEENIHAGLLKALKGIKRNDLHDQVKEYLSRYYARK